MSNIIKVAQIIGKSNAGGVESMIMNIYRNIDREKVQFDFFVENTSVIINKVEIEEMGGNVVIIPSYSNPVKFVKVLSKLLKQGDYDIVHSNMNAISVFALKAAKNAGIRIRIAHSHSTSNKRELIRNIVKKILRRFSKKYATHYFACSEKAGRWLFGDNTYDEGKVLIINNAIDLEKFKFSQEIRYKMRMKLDVANKFVVGHVGRFVQQKNHMFLIDIFYEILKNNPNSVLLLIGAGPLYSEVVKYTEKLKISNKVIFSGVHEHTEAYYQAMDGFVLPSLYEGLPVVGVEAQVNGLNCYFANTITAEAKINNNVEFVSLNLSAKKWADIISQYDDYDRLASFSNFENSKYNIKNEAKKLLSLYKFYLEEIK